MPALNVAMTINELYRLEDDRPREEIGYQTIIKLSRGLRCIMPKTVTVRRTTRALPLAFLMVITVLAVPGYAESPASPQTVASVDDFLMLVGSNAKAPHRALHRIEQGWHPGNRAMLVEAYVFSRNHRVSKGILALLERKTGEKLGDHPREWFVDIWNKDYQPHPEYASFKARLYDNIDPRFREYFVQADEATIRLDEIRWGGVVRDGIPPLKNPTTLPANEANYLADSDIVFGVVVNGEARAYPKRILAWHEMVKDVVGGKAINGVYCTLCGSMIVYLPEHKGVHYELGTSGFLYRSNKLMYDHRTKSMWSTIQGEPVVGSLVGKGIKLEPHHLVTTTWGKWKSEHPETRVLSLRTGHRRDYGEGVAYRDYFATDELMFGVPKTDDRLLNKDEVFIVRAGSDVAKSEPLAISADFLKKHPIHHDKIGDVSFVVLTDGTGANRAYKTDVSFKRVRTSNQLVDESGSSWTVTEDAITSDSGQRGSRLPAHRAFWFGWQAVYPKTRLVK